MMHEDGPQLPLDLPVRYLRDGQHVCIWIVSRPLSLVEAAA
jgi:hypothetical protein